MKEFDSPLNMQFRAWDKELEIFEDEENIFINQNGSVYREQEGKWYNDRYDIQFCIGLRDSKRTTEFSEGQRIFRGDRILATNQSGWSREFEVIWKDQTRAMAWCSEQPEISFDLTLDSITTYRVIVVGNSHEIKNYLEDNKIYFKGGENLVKI